MSTWQFAVQTFWLSLVWGLFGTCVVTAQWLFVGFFLILAVNMTRRWHMLLNRRYPL